jgi:hypothetical protein
MTCVNEDEQRLMKKNLLRLTHGNTMFVIFASVAFVPLKTDYDIKINHD